MAARRSIPFLDSTSFRLAIALTIAVAVAAAPRPAAERLAIRTFTAADGLPRDQVRALLADSRGFLWLGTHEGLARFDGVDFTLFGPAEGLANPAVYDLIEDRAGRYWIATGGGVYRSRRARASSCGCRSARCRRRVRRRSRPPHARRAPPPCCSKIAMA